METSFRGAYKEFTVETLFSPELEVPEPKIIWRTKATVTTGLVDPSNEELIQIAERGLNIVSSRDVRRNVRKSLEIAVDLAAEGRRVLYVNSYASLGMLRERLQSALATVTLPELPAPPAPPAPPEGESDGECNDECNDERGDDDEDAPPSTKYPFRILHCKMGLWEQCQSAVEEALYIERFVSYASEEITRTQMSDVIIVNSFEFAAVEYRSRLALVTKLLEWLGMIGLTAIVFTQEVKAMMEAGIPVRGPLGLLTTSATTLSKLDMPMRGRNPGVHEKKQRVNEHVPNTAIRIFYDGGGNLAGVEYPKKYKGHRYELGFFPRHLIDPIPDGIEAVQIVGMPPMNG